MIVTSRPILSIPILSKFIRWPKPFGPQACVISCDRVEGGIGASMTLMSDSAKGLPLDSIYSTQLSEMRQSGRRLVEVGLFADCRQDAASSATTLFGLMRWAYYFALHVQADDIVIGVHPHHVKFYTRVFGFECFGPSTMYPTVNNSPVVPLRLMIAETFVQTHLSRGMRYVLENPINTHIFESRFAFTPMQLSGSAIEGFINAKHTATSRRTEPRNTVSRFGVVTG